MTAPEIESDFEGIVQYLEGQVEAEEKENKTYALKTYGNTRIIYES